MSKSTSYKAINDYIHHDKQNSSRHVSRVVVRTSGRTVLNKKLEVFASIETNYCFVDIDWNGNEELYYARYRNDYQDFEFDNEVLIISAEDKSGKDIKIEIYS